ncbi:MAG: BadF/BadG/BcrA/BcrD ATPase family protein [Lacipirellulaceae bacterium]
MSQEPTRSELDETQSLIVLGVDGGGTKTVAWLALIRPGEDMSIIGRGRAGTSNVMAVGLSEATANLQAAILQAWKDSPFSPRSVDFAVFALSGAGLESVQQQISLWVERQEIAQKLEIIHDAQAVLSAGTPAGSGVALISGTGSVAIGRSTEDSTIITGGWGYWFGDEGSAFSIGQEALRAVAQAHDGRGGETILTDAILKQVGASDPRKLLEALSSENQTRYAIASLAREVSVAAESNDEVALGIVDQAATSLAKLAETTAEKLSLGSSFPLALAGGVLCGSEPIRKSMLRKLDDSAVEPNPLKIVTDPVVGCLELARKNLESSD